MLPTQAETWCESWDPQVEEIQFLPWWIETKETVLSDINAAKLCIYVLSFLCQKRNLLSED